MTVTVTDVRKAWEDMNYAGLIDIYNAKYAETACLAGVDTSVAFAGDPFDTADDYIIYLYEAFDVNGIDIRQAIEIKSLTVNGFVFNSPRDTTIKWTANRRYPKMNFWTP